MALIPIDLSSVLPRDKGPASYAAQLVTNALQPGGSYSSFPRSGVIASSGMPIPAGAIDAMGPSDFMPKVTTANAGLVDATTNTARLADIKTRMAGTTAAEAAADVGAAETAAANTGRLGGLVEQLGGKGALMKAGAYTAAGQIGKGIFDNVVGQRDGVWDDAIGTGLAGAGVGAGIGALGGPFDPITVPMGALIGFGGGFLWGALRGGDSNETNMHREVNKQDKKLNAIYSEAGLSTEATAQIRTQLAASLTYAENPAQVKAIYQQVASAIPGIAAQEQQQRQQLAGLLATQQALAPGFDSYLQGLGASSQAFNQAVNNTASTFGNPAQAAYMQQLGASTVMSDQATAAAYKQQANLGAQQMASQIGAPQSMYQQLLAQYG